MNWMHDTAEIYDTVMRGDIKEPEGVPLVPVCHTQINAHIEITLDEDGRFRNARMVDKSESVTIIPCTEESGSRSGKKPASHPLHDKLQYLAADFRTFGGVVTVGFAKETGEPHNRFMEGLAAWCASPHVHPKVSVVLKYLEGKTLLADLQQRLNTILFQGGQFREAFTKKNAFATGTPMDCLIRWRVDVQGDPESRLWCDRAVQKSWCDYYFSSRQERGLCYVTGKIVPLASLHPARLRNGGDKAKLISANDPMGGFVYRGRFTTEQEACGVGFEFSQKAHSGLRWLIARQGRVFGDCAYVVWGEGGSEEPPSPFDDTEAILDSLNVESGRAFSGVASERGEVALDRDEKLATEKHVSLAAIYAENLMKSMAGYRGILGQSHRNIRIVAIDSATPGRMSLVLDRAIESSHLLDNLENWHRDAAWLQNYGQPDKTKPSRRFIGAPAPIDIAKTAFGEEPNKKLLSSTINRILPVIIDKARFPEELCRACVSRVFRRNGLSRWEWEKALGIACSLFRYTHKEREYQMELEEDRSTRDYLWGCLLALAEVTERYSLDKQSAEKRPTNAEKLFARFAEQPYATWPSIEKALRPYLARLIAGDENAQGIRKRFDIMSDAIMAKFQTANLDFTNNARLSGEFLLGYHCQRHALYTKKCKTEQVNEAQAIGKDAE